MTSLFESYEQQYSVLSAEITSEIGRLKRIPAGKVIRKKVHNFKTYCKFSHLRSSSSFFLVLQTMINVNKSGQLTRVLMKVRNW